MKKQYWMCTTDKLYSEKYFEECPICHCKMIYVDEENEKKTSKAHLIEESIWCQDIFNYFPGVVAHEYRRVYDLNNSDNLLAMQIKLKDAIETVIKYSVLSVCSWAKAHEIPGREVAYEREMVSKDLSLGDWVKIAGKLISFFNLETESKGENKQGLPWQLADVLLDIPSWESKNLIVHWRNTKVGHGALGFQEDETFRKDLRRMFLSYNQFLSKHLAQFMGQRMYALCDDKRIDLVGYKNTARNIDFERGCVCIEMCEDNAETFVTEPFIVLQDHCIFFFDEMKKSQNRILSYPAGVQKSIYDEYTNSIRKRLMEEKGWEVFRTPIKGGMISSEISSALDRISLGGNLGQGYTSPYYLVEWLKELVNDRKNGIFLLKMERGCGKTVFTEKLNSIFNSPEIISSDLQVRTYHFSRTQRNGSHEFERAMDDIWSKTYSDKIKGPFVDVDRPIRMNDYSNIKQADKRLCSFLDGWRQFTETCPTRSGNRIMLVLDGLDEINDPCLWEYIPSKNTLPDGVYILLTGRDSQKENVPELYTNQLSSHEFDEVKTVNSNDQDNLSFIRAFINLQCPGIIEKDVCSIFDLSDKTALSATMLCALYRGGIHFDNTFIPHNATHFFLDVLNQLYLTSSQSEQFERLLTVLSTIAEKEPVDISEIADLCFYNGVTIELLGMLNDISPLLSIERGWSIDDRQIAGSNRYHCSNMQVSQNIRSWLNDKMSSYLWDIVACNLPDNGDIGRNASPGQSVIVSCFMNIMLEYCEEHLSEIIENKELPLKINRFLNNYIDSEAAISLYDKERELRSVEQTILLYQLFVLCGRYIYFANALSGYFKRYASLLGELHEFKSAMIALQESKKINELLYIDELIPEDEYYLNLAMVYGNTSILQSNMEFSDKALDSMKKSTLCWERCVLLHWKKENIQNLAIAYAKYANLLDLCGKRNDAVSYYEKSIRIIGSTFFTKTGFDQHEAAKIYLDYVTMLWNGTSTADSKVTSQMLEIINKATQIVDQVLKNSTDENDVTLVEKITRISKRISSGFTRFDYETGNAENDNAEEDNKAQHILDEIIHYEKLDMEGLLFDRRLLASSYFSYGRQLDRERNMDAAELYVKKAIDLFETIDTSGKLYSKEELSACYSWYAHLSMEKDDLGVALQSLKKAIQLIKQMESYGQQYDEIVYSKILSQYADVLVKIENYQDAICVYEQTITTKVKIFEYVFSQDYYNKNYEDFGYSIVENYINLAYAYEKNDSHQMSVVSYKNAYQFCEKYLYGVDGFILKKYFFCLLEKPDEDKFDKQEEERLRIFLGIAGLCETMISNGFYFDLYDTLADTYFQIGMIYKYQNKYLDAENALKNSIQVNESAHGERDKSKVSIVADIAETYYQLSSIKRMQGDELQGEVYLKKSKEYYDMFDAYENDSDNMNAAVTYNAFARVKREKKDYVTAVRMFMRAVDLTEDMANRNKHKINHAIFCFNTLQCLFKCNMYDEYIELFNRKISLIHNACVEKTSLTKRLADAYRGRAYIETSINPQSSTDAIVYLKKAIELMESLDLHDDETNTWLKTESLVLAGICRDMGDEKGALEYEKKAYKW